MDYIDYKSANNAQACEVIKQHEPFQVFNSRTDSIINAAKGVAGMLVAVGAVLSISAAASVFSAVAAAIGLAVGIPIALMSFIGVVESMNSEDGESSKSTKEANEALEIMEAPLMEALKQAEKYAYGNSRGSEIAKACHELSDAIHAAKAEKNPVLRAAARAAVITAAYKLAQAIQKAGEPAVWIEKFHSFGEGRTPTSGEDLGTDRRQA